MNPAQISRSSHSFLPNVSDVSHEARNSHAQSSPQGRTQAFIASGELNAAFGRTSTAAAHDFTNLLGTFQRELEKNPLSYLVVAELGSQLSEASLGEQGGHWLGNDEQQALKGMIDRCTRQLADTSTSHASYEPLSQICEDLKTARLQQSISQMTSESHAPVRGIPDLLALTHLDPHVLAGQPSCEKFGSFVSMARNRTAELSENLRGHPAEVSLLLHPHADTLLGLERLPDALAAWTEHCPDTSTRHDLHDLAKGSGELLQQLRDNKLLPRSAEADGESSAHTSLADYLSLAPEDLRHIPPHAASSRSGSHVSADIADDTQKVAGLYAEKKRTHWTKSTGVAGKVSHKIQSLLGMRDAESRVKGFVAFMADAKGSPDATMLDLGDGWMRVTRDVKGETALIDVRCDSDGQVVDARHPGKFPSLPEGSERQAFDTVLKELKLRGSDTLSKVPVYYVNRNTRGYAIPTHGYVVAGHPNQGRKSGAILYGVGGDPKRGPVVLNEKLLGHLVGKPDSKMPDKLSEPVRTTISALAGRSFATREDFYNAYSAVRGDAVDPQELHNEIASIYRHLPMSSMEMWPKRAGDYRVAKPPAPERDLRAFENMPKDIGRKVQLKKMSDVDSIDLLEAKRQFTLHQLYQDEMLGRDGTGVPSPGMEPKVDEQRREQLQISTPKFQRLPPHATDKVGNCNTGASSLLQRAVDTYTEKNNLPPQKVTAASVFGIGSSHRLSIWDPLNGSSSGKSTKDR
ncbi:HopW family type III effector protein [Erwinia psidii]|uniref:Effector protein n=1 Tax=Erwinia psidii TaxID=69224 RepID=A0A3N6UUS4_9GAMM|nr:HopW family type III effector protein [Erwinia psidii]MCX8958741.1 effector protein [Erwinia psidii]RQM36595.1 effector protein [Erwinia psidii]